MMACEIILGRVHGLWMQLDSCGLAVLQDDGAGGVSETRITPRQFAALNRDPTWLAGVEWRPVGTDRCSDDGYGASVLRDWSMAGGSVWQTFDGFLPVRVARRMRVV